MHVTCNEANTHKLYLKICCSLWCQMRTKQMRDLGLSSHEMIYHHEFQSVLHFRHFPTSTLYDYIVRLNHIAVCNQMKPGSSRWIDTEYSLKSFQDSEVQFQQQGASFQSQSQNNQSHSQHHHSLAQGDQSQFQSNKTDQSKSQHDQCWEEADQPKSKQTLRQLPDLPIEYSKQLHDIRKTMAVDLTHVVQEVKLVFHTPLAIMYVIMLSICLSIC